ncbi:MAG: SprB repeat-containing protein, partial [Bacteroidia bacterium]|nr:SprB repeat-containing protein [Bacteroidia bacterium]
MTNVSCFGGNNGAINITPAGGTNPYTFIWSNGATTQNISNLTAGSYSVTVYDYYQCYGSGAWTVTAPAELEASAGYTDILCFGGTSTVTVTATGGTLPYSGTGSFGETAGNYSYTVTDANGCTATTTVTITEPSYFMAHSHADQILCHGGTTMVSVSGMGGTEPYTGTGAFQVPAGTYTYTVTDANGCTATTTVTITEPSFFMAHAHADQILCHGGTTIVTVSGMGGTAPYSSIGTFTVAAGTYTYTIYDAYQCSAEVTITVTEPDELTSTSTAAPILCAGGSTEFTWHIQGGVPPYHTFYYLLGGSIPIPADGSMMIGAGSGYFTIYDSNNCTTDLYYDITEPSPLIASAVATDILCNGGSSTITVDATGGTPPYSGIGTFTEYTGNYTFTIMDANGCSAMTNISITEPDPLDLYFGAGIIYCNGGTTDVEIYAYGGVGGYIGMGDFTEYAGTYTYPVWDANGCYAEIPILITEPSVLMASASATDILCNGGSSEVDVSADGGTPPYYYTGTYYEYAGSYSYDVMDFNGCMATTNISITEPEALQVYASAGEILCNGGIAEVDVWANGGVGGYIGTGYFPESAGTYTFPVWDANGCYADVTITITEPAVLMASATTTDILCHGDMSTVTITATGGTEPYYGPGSSDFPAGTYTVTVFDANQCSTDVTFTITEPDELIATAVASPILCNGDLSTIEVSATGGVPPYYNTGTYSEYAGTYNFYSIMDANGCSAIASVTITEPDPIVVSVVTGDIFCNGESTWVEVSATGGVGGYYGTGYYVEYAGTYTYPVWDANGCYGEFTVSITEPQVLMASASASDILCNGGVSNVEVSATGGTPPYYGVGTYSELAGNYTYTVMDFNGCNTYTSISITEPEPVQVYASAGEILCNGGTTVVQIWATGGVGGYSGVDTFGPYIAGTYNFVVDDANQCSAEVFVTITEPDQLIASATATDILCNGGVSDVEVSATGGVLPYDGVGTFYENAGNYSYMVMDGNGCMTTAYVTISEPEALQAYASPGEILCNGGTTEVEVWATGGVGGYIGTGYFTESAGTYTYPVWDANGCYADVTVIITEPDQLMASATATDILCNGGISHIQVSATGGTPPYNGTGMYNEFAGDYTYTVTDANGCIVYTSISINEPEAIQVYASAGEILCNDGTTEVEIWATGGVGGYIGTGFFTVSASPYVFTVWDANDCNASVTVTITEPPVLMASATATDILCNGGMSTVTVTASGGTPPYSGTGDFYEPAGQYGFTVSDANGCNTVVTGSITQPDALQAYAYAGDIQCNGESTWVYVIAIGGVPPYSGTGNFNEGAGDYSYPVYDSNQCMTTATVSISEPDMLIVTDVVSDYNGYGVSAFGATDGWINLSVTGGTMPYYYSWSNGATDENLYNLGAGIYMVTITDANGCVAMMTFMLTQPGTNNLEGSISATDVNCFQSCNGTVDVMAWGGTSPYNFMW